MHSKVKISSCNMVFYNLLLTKSEIKTKQLGMKQNLYAQTRKNKHGHVD